ncbi:GNAT family N-acetyltransferase [Frankia sp. Cas4]|uniref:GNAT family N-acetyltransferase n=1 Tax=Frankia sp. Cas4 TaxID=3073927 RepID=UPI002AD53D5C|nr:GNAT family N-acetyltransferase [Frankia sp. Cas4]
MTTPWTLTVHAGGQDPGRLRELIEPVYAEVYAEAPYCEGPDDVAEFAAGWPRRVGAPGFRAVIATVDDRPVGMTFGHPLAAETGWWEGLVERAPDEVTAEDGHRSFAVIELAVLASHRRRGLGRALHDGLLAGRDEQRVVLLVRPEPDAAPARAAYASWGYRTIGQLRPWEDAPVYLALVRVLDAGR